MAKRSSRERTWRASLVTRMLAWTVVHLRFLVVPGWIAGAVAAVLLLPGFTSAPSPGLRDLLPPNAEPVRAAAAAGRLFSVPAVTGMAVVHRDPAGLPPLAELKAAARARAASRRDRRITAAVPITDRIVQGRLRPTTVVYYVFTRLGTTTGQALAAGRAFAARLPHGRGTVTAVSGLIPAELAHSDLVRSMLGRVELATILWVLVAVALHFRSLVAPLVDLLAVAISYLLAVHLVGWLSGRLGHSIPAEAQPVIVVLLFGIVTDYTIFLISRHRIRLAEGATGREAAGRATRDVAGIVFAAGITVCAATATVAAARMQFFSLFGPAMAISVLVAVLVAVTFVPAALAMLGRWALWPSRPHGRVARERAVPATAARRATPLRGLLVGLGSRRPIITSVVLIAALLAGASGLRHYALAVPEVRALPADSEARRGYSAAQAGFGTPGILAPTPLILHASGVARSRAALARLQGLLADQPGVAHVLGPAQQPIVRPLGLVLSKSGNAARYLLVLDGAPLGTRAIATLDRVRRQAPALVRRAGLGRAQLLWGGETALARTVVQRTTGDLELVGPLALAAIFLVLIIFLRAVVAPLYLIFASALSVAAALGITGYLHDTLVAPEGIGFFVPFATAVLLLALGSDYTVFLIGRIWQEAPGRPLREAIIAAGTRASRPITVAGIILAGSFAMLAIVPIAAYRLAAITMALGLLIDALLVRTLLVPALVSLFGRRSGGTPVDSA